MRVWLITLGEPLPIDSNDERTLRSGLFAQQLLREGHSVVWWTSTFDHTRKRHRFAAARDIRINPEFEIRLLRGTGYRRNVSFARALDHYILGRRFRSRVLRDRETPDVIVCSYPTIDFAYESVAFGRSKGIPVLVDIRDLWPESFLDYMPRASRRIVRGFLRPLFQRARLALRGASGLIGITESYLNWALAHAGRNKSDADCVVPLGYPASNRSEVPVDYGDFWTSRGIVKRSNEVVCCFIGTLSRTFDFDTVMNAARVLAGEPFKFVMCGVGEDLERLRSETADLRNVLFPGWINGAQIRSLMDISHVGLAPYRRIVNYQSGLPNKPIEYLAGRLAVITSLSGELKRLLDAENAGLGYEEGSVMSLVAALRDLQQDRNRLEVMRDNAGNLFERRFRADTVYSALIRHLSGVVTGAARA